MTIITNNKDLMQALDHRIVDLKRTDAWVTARSKTSPLGPIRRRGGGMTTETMFALAKALGLTITIQTDREAKAALYKDTPVNEQPIVMTGFSERPQPYITDIKILQTQPGRWAMFVKKSDSADWVHVQVE